MRIQIHIRIILVLKFYYPFDLEENFFSAIFIKKTVKLVVNFY